MIYIITESRLENIMMEYFDNMFPRDKIWWQHPVDSDYDKDEEFEDAARTEYYFKIRDDDNPIFRYYRRDYFSTYAYQHENAPLLEIDDDYSYNLNQMFGDKWEEPFKKWFEEKFGNPVNTIT